MNAPVPCRGAHRAHAVHEVVCRLWQMRYLSLSGFIGVGTWQAGWQQGAGRQPGARAGWRQADSDPGCHHESHASAGYQAGAGSMEH